MTKYQMEQTKQSILYMCRLAFKSVALIITVGYALVYAILHIHTANAATLNPQAAISADVVKLSDLFSDIDVKHDAVLGSSPEPGKTLIIGATTLKRVASLYNVDWQPASVTDQVVVTRTASTVTSDQIIEALKQSLAAKGVSGDFALTLGGTVPSMTLAGDVPATVEVAQLTYTPGRNVFTAVVAAPNASAPVKTLSLSGMIEKVQNVPVLRSSLKAGDIINASDISWTSVNARNLVADTIIDADRMIGKTPARAVDAGAVVRERDLVSPQMIARGDEILIQFSSGTLQLTAKGKAMQNGAEGDVIRVMNMASNQAFRAEIVGNKTVRVQ